MQNRPGSPCPARSRGDTTVARMGPICLALDHLRGVGKGRKGEKMGEKKEREMEKKWPYPFNRRSLLLRHANLLCSRWEGRVVIGVLGEQLQELFRVLSDQLRQLRIPRADLLQDRFQHVGLGLNDRAQLLKLGVTAEEIQVAQPGSGGSRSRRSRPTSFSKQSTRRR